MRCEKHGKEILGSCQWCGLSLCRLDVGKRLGNKLFCLECSENLGKHIEKRQMQMIYQEKLKEAKQKEYRRIIK